MKRNSKKKVIWISSILSLVIVLISVSGIYVSDYYHADKDAIAGFTYSESVSIKQIDKGGIVYTPEDAVAGFIFYPGGKVEYTAYEPLMLACAEQGILCVLLEMPFNLAVLDMNAANGIPALFPDIENWYIGGHSLGGSIAASYASKNTNIFKGLVLLGSYSTADISNSNMKVLSIYGSEDQVLNRDNYKKNRDNLPKDFFEYVIDGGCHAYFGMYGPQEGDGTPTISNAEQIRMTAEEICGEICK